MIKLLTSGGLGDTVLSYAKIFSKHAPFDANSTQFKVTHITNKRGAGTFANSISEFYASQNIQVRIQFDVKGERYRRANRHKYDYYLGTHWLTSNIKDEDSWEINPFPPIRYTEQENSDIIISPFGGWNQSRKTGIDNILKIDSPRISYIGKQIPENYRRLFDNLEGTNLINKLTTQDFVNIIGSCNIVISQDGFPGFLGAMCRKKVFIFDHIDGLTTKDRCHPEWDTKVIYRVEDIEL